MLPAWIGVWTLTAVLSADPSASTLYKHGTKHIDSTGTAVTIVDEFVRSRGGILHLEWTGRFDGRDYPVQGVELALTSAYRQVDDHTLELVQKIDGASVLTARVTLSADGQTITTESSGGRSKTTTTYKKR
jgi:hypothetical protein